MDVGYADNAGAITCHLIGDEKLFGFLVMRHSDASRARLKAPTFGAWTFVIQLHFLGSDQSPIDNFASDQPGLHEYSPVQRRIP